MRKPCTMFDHPSEHSDPGVLMSLAKKINAGHNWRAGVTCEAFMGAKKQPDPGVVIIRFYFSLSCPFVVFILLKCPAKILVLKSAQGGRDENVFV